MKDKIENSLKHINYPEEKVTLLLELIETFNDDAWVILNRKSGMAEHIKEKFKQKDIKEGFDNAADHYYNIGVKLNEFSSTYKLLVQQNIQIEKQKSILSNRNDVFTIKQAAEILDCDEKHIRKLIDMKQLKAFNIGLGELNKTYRITQENINDYIKLKQKEGGN